MRVILALIVMLVFQGCATSFCITVQRPEVVYPATRLDLLAIPMLWDGNVSRFEAVCLTPVAIVDCPFSLITDTIMLPYDLWR